MNNVKKVFGIKDLENLSGIKAHTIRIWEKRYNLFSPERTDTNIRSYSLASLQKLLNITLLYNNGYKISKIAQMGDEKITTDVKEIIAIKSVKDHAISSFKLAMINFDYQLFDDTYNALLVDRPFPVIFKEIFVPLLHELGLLWQTNTIQLSHEHFLLYLIKEKIYVQTEKLRKAQHKGKDKTFVLFLPENEIHEIGLLYLNYEVALKGYKSIFLGPTVPLESLVDFTKFYADVHFISYFTVEPTQEKLDKYMATYQDTLGRNGVFPLWVLGHQTQFIDPKKMPANIRIFNSIDETVNAL